MGHRGSPHLLVRAAAVLATGLVATGARPEGPFHPLPAGPPPLHQRLAEAQAVALATVDAVEPGRIQLRDGEALLGSVAARFALKRAPSNPPRLAVGDRALLLLRGARSPYVLASERGAALKVDEDAASARWSAALDALLAAGNDPDRLLVLYLAWLEGEHRDQREEAATALLAPGFGFHPVSVEIALGRARAAVDPQRPPTVRRVSASLAVGRDEGISALLAGLSEAGPTADSEVFRLGLAAAASRRHPALPRLLVQAFSHPDAALRRQALAFAPAAWSDVVAAQVGRLAGEDPEPAVRAAAERVLARQTPQQPPVDGH